MKSKKQGRKRVVSLNVDKLLLRRLDRYAEKVRASRSSVAGSAIQIYIEQMEGVRNGRKAGRRKNKNS